MALTGKTLGTVSKSKVRGTGGMKDAVAARKAASVTAGAAAPKTTTAQTGFGVLGNPKAGAGKGPRGVGGALRTAAGGMKTGSGRAKPSGMY